MSRPARALRWAASAHTVAAGKLIVVVLAMAGCSGGPVSTPPVTPGTAQAPREVNIIAKDDQFIPDVVDLVPGETVLIHLINGGLDVHELVIGNQAVQNAWEAAEAAAAGAPPGPTPQVSVPPGLGGLRVVVQSGQRVDIRWTVPSASVGPLTTGSAGASGDAGDSALIAGCHIPGHYARGMHVPIRFVRP